MNAVPAADIEKRLIPVDIDKAGQLTGAGIKKPGDEFFKAEAGFFRIQ